MRRVLCGIGLLLLLGTVAPSAPASASGRPPDWKLAVVFRRDGGARTYAGTVTDPVLPRRLPRLEAAPGAAGASPSEADHEVWLVADTTIYGLWFSAARGAVGSLSAAGQAGPARRDDGSIQRLVGAARPPAAGPRRPAAVRSLIVGGAPPASLASLVAEADLVVTGQVVGVLRQAYSGDSPAGVEQHTVSVVAVEARLTPGGGPPLVRVWQEGGSLDGGYEVVNDPLLRPGGRYLLFLRAGDGDEYRTVHPACGKILLRDGLARLPRGAEGWKFSRGPQIVGVPEAQALGAVRQVTVARR